MSTVLSRCINCQILGMQKAIDFINHAITIEDVQKKELAQELVNDLNDFIQTHTAFSIDAEHLLELNDDGEHFSIKLIPKP